MCGGVEFLSSRNPLGLETPKRVFFPMPHVQIPVVTVDEGLEFLQWGKRQGEDSDIDVPVTGWARLESLVQGKWSQYNPVRVKVPVLRWMEKDPAKASHWFEMAPETYLLGIRIDKPERSFVYIATRPASDAFRHIHEREPMITQGSAET